MTEKVAKPKIAYMCSYVPYGLLEQLGFEMVFINGADSTLASVEHRLPVSLCSYVRCCQQVIDTSDYDGIILTNCCNATQRLYDYVETKIKGKFCSILELPRGNSRKECEFFYISVLNLVNHLCEFFNIDKVRSLESAFEEEGAEPDNKSCRKVLILGSAVSPQTIESFKEYFKVMEIRICATKSRGDKLLKCFSSKDAKNPVIFEDKFPLGVEPCPRMDYFSQWFEDWIPQMLRAVLGVVFITPQKCDNFLFSYPLIKKVCDYYHIPVIQIEEEYGSTAGGQNSVRLEAFSESLEFNRRKYGNENCK